MRKTIVWAAVTMLIVGTMAVPVSAKQAKVEICHLNGASDPGIPTLDGSLTRTFELGKLRHVAAAAVAAHVAHGDSATFLAPGGNTLQDGIYRTDTDPIAPFTYGLSAVVRAAGEHGLRAWKHADCFITRYDPTP